MRTVVAGLLFVSALVGSAACAKQDSIVPDISLNFVCANGAPSESAIEQFLKEHNFEVANLERVRRQVHQAFFPMDIEAIDNRSWIIDFRGFATHPLPAKPAEIFYSVGVYSPPPTQHDKNLEDAVETFVKTSLGCKETSFNRGSNPADAADFFQYTLATQKSRMHEAEICDRTMSTYNAGQCAKVPGMEQ